MRGRCAPPRLRSGLRLLKSWGGVTIAYRRRMIDSPSYTLNHEEVAKALEEGIVFAEGLTPARIEVDKYGHASAVTFQDGIQLPARSVLIAAGTQPNTVLAREEGVEPRARRQVLPGLRRERRAGQARAPHRQAEDARRCCCTAIPTVAS